MTTLFAHGEEIIQRGGGDYLGSPMYSVIAEHSAAILAVFTVVVGAWIVRRLAPSRDRFARWLDSYRALGVLDRMLFWLLATSGAVHAGLALGHEPSGYTSLYVVDAALLWFVTRRLLLGGRWRRWAGLTLVGSLMGYAVAGMAGEPPDQVGLATKLVELAALAIVLTPRQDRRLRRALASTAVVTLTIVVGIGAWAGAFQSGDGGHHLGATPTPGVLLPNGEDRDPTAHETREAESLYQEVVAGVARYRDPALASAAGYNLEGIYGLEFHASNAAFQADGRILDPERPETLIWAVSDGGPVLVGALFEMSTIGDAGPAPGGPLTVWHAHDHVCFSLTPPALAGLVSPFGGCPLGSISVARTAEMIHVWTLPGVEEPFGDIDQEWLAAYLSAMD
ncbi:MAG: hypothetical protein IH941_06290 [Acidobacteria bacterium]|nr:hypothetical protein [Acidobacteriota bacterium]